MSTPGLQVKSYPQVTYSPWKPAPPSQQAKPTVKESTPRSPMGTSCSIHAFPPHLHSIPGKPWASFLEPNITCPQIRMLRPPDPWRGPRTDSDFREGRASLRRARWHVIWELANIDGWKAPCLQGEWEIF